MKGYQPRAVLDIQRRCVIKGNCDLSLDQIISTFIALFDNNPRQGFHDPVARDIPVRAMSGTKDMQTDTAKHAMIQLSQYARGAAEGFMENPEAPVNAASTAALKPDFYVSPAAQ